MLPCSAGLWAGHPGAFWGSVSQILVCKIPVCRLFLVGGLSLSSSFPFACKCFSLKSTKPPLPSPSFKRTLLGFRRALFGYPALPPHLILRQLLNKSLGLKAAEGSLLGSRGCSRWLLALPGFTAPVGCCSLTESSMEQSWMLFLTARAGRRGLAKRW